MNLVNKQTIGIAITQWNHANLTQQLLSTLISANDIKHITICDNGSDESEYLQTVRYLDKKMDRCESGEKSFITLLRNRNNSGFSIGTNLAISELLGQNVDWVWLLNNDTEISEPHLEQISKQLQKKQPGIYGTSISEAGIGKFTGAYRYNYFSNRHHPIYEEHNLLDHAQSNRYISGASIIIHKSVFEAVGLLCEDTFLYYEELDFSFRARAKGFKQGFISGPEVKHIGAGSSDSFKLNHVRIYNETWSLLNFYHNHKRAMIPWVLIIRMPIRVIMLALSGRSTLITNVVSAELDFYRKRHKFSAPANVNETKYFTRS